MWNLGKDEGYNIEEEQKILLYDLAGQVSSLYTSLQNLSDADSIFVVFKQTDRKTLDMALTHLDELLPLLSDQCKLYLVQNFVDHTNNDLAGFDFKEIIEKYSFVDIMKISSLEGTNIKQMQDILINDIDWENVRYMVQSKYETDVLNKIEELSSTDLVEKSMSSSEFDSQLGNEIWIPKQHLIYILENLSRQGIIEYIKELDKIIIDDPSFNELQSIIPTFVQNQDGWCNTEKIYAELGQNDENRLAYIRYHINTLKNNLKAVILSEGNVKNETLIIPSLLQPGDLDCTEELMELLTEQNSRKLLLDECNFPWFSFLNYVSTFNLNCVKLNNNNAIFSTKSKSFCFQIIHSPIIIDRRRKLEISLISGGLNKSISSKIATQIQNFIISLFPNISLSNQETFQKPIALF